MELSERLARHEEKVQARIADCEGFKLPDHDELKGEAEFLSGAKGPDVDAAIAAEERYVDLLRRLIPTRQEADRRWSGLGTDPENLEHRQGGLAAFEELLPESSGSASDEYLLQAAPSCTEAAILYAYKFLLYGLVKLDADRLAWWGRKSDDERLGEALDLIESFAGLEPDRCRKALTKDGTLAVRVVDAMRSEDPLDALRADLL